MRRKEGQWKREQYLYGPDSSLHGNYHNNNLKSKQMFQMTLGTIDIVRAEPIYRQTAIDVQYVQGGGDTNVAWPGPQVNASVAGLASPSSQQIHGLWEAPLPGQQVLVGFVEGNLADPIVINKYPYNALQDPAYEAAHNQPLTQKEHGPLDVVLGHFTGSFIALRGTLPLPAHIDVYSESSMLFESQVETSIKSLDVKIESTTGAKVYTKSSGLIAIFNAVESLQSILSDLIDATSGIITTGSPAVHTVNAASQTALLAIKTRVNLLLGSS